MKAHGEIIMNSDKKIIKAVEQFFSRDVRRGTMLIRSAISISSVRMDVLPGSSNSNDSENKMIAYSEAKQRQALIKSAFKLMDTDEATVLESLYIKGWSTTKTALTLCVSTRSVFRLRKRALLDFAYCYNMGELLDRMTNGKVTA